MGTAKISKGHILYDSIYTTFQNDILEMEQISGPGVKDGGRHGRGEVGVAIKGQHKGSSW